jgi:hypothetical protein
MLEKEGGAHAFLFAEARYSAPMHLGSRKFNPSLAVFALTTAIATALAASVGCGGSTGGFAPSPAAVEPPARDLSAAKNAKFKPLIQAILVQRKAAKELSDFRASFGSTGMDEAGSAKYSAMFAKVGDAGQRVTDLAVEADFQGDDKRVFNMIASLDDAQLKSILQ